MTRCDVLFQRAALASDHVNLTAAEAISLRMLFDGNVHGCADTMTEKVGSHLVALKLAETVRESPLAIRITPKGIDALAAYDKSVR